MSFSSLYSPMARLWRASAATVAALPLPTLRPPPLLIRFGKSSLFVPCANEVPRQRQRQENRRGRKWSKTKIFEIFHSRSFRLWRRLSISLLAAFKLSTRVKLFLCCLFMRIRELHTHSPLSSVCVFERLYAGVKVCESSTLLFQFAAWQAACAAWLDNSMWIKMPTP